MSGDEELVYARGELSVEEIQSAIAQFWQILDNAGDPALEGELREAGLERAMLAGVDRKDAIIVQAGSSGVDPTTAVILVTLAPSANLIIKDLWRKVVLPRILKQRGDDAIGEEKRSDD
jgi:hypothetical protein